MFNTLTTVKKLEGELATKSALKALELSTNATINELEISMNASTKTLVYKFP